MEIEKIAIIILYVIVLVLFVFMYYLANIIIEFLKRLRYIEGLETQTLNSGSLSPYFSVKDLKGNSIKINEKTTIPTIMLFLNPTCETCRTILNNISTLNNYEFTSRVVIVGKDSLSGEIVSNVLSNNVYLVENSDLFNKFYINSVPTMISIGSNSTIKSIGLIDNIDELIKELNIIENRSNSVLMQV
ncbi:hypothetical protein [Lysinibacillus fusiformis]|uniref:hypothetical protein n=1 Tax=Lysinibacillus fusiformis TaxID=28031 RepID=UPI0000F38FE6|nr:hypothetical protein [Lysinibacillus fusiformis]EAZ84577.1 hypothetical protein BB14905_21538 [Bacillus sp. B14905]MED4079068.1 hypothetical protein [Lysinibacillus fusiformis]SCX51895.1 hypothetical protein SAMN02787108_01837 [Lysinibacillus fusiformis]SDB27924.1 hypothetical protein SAMN02787070_02025 [Lysinibacillus fusiformis]SFI22614.1 hypothetical protein SAMN02787080_02024 [Lysinibacillus fusiformis]